MKKFIVIALIPALVACTKHSSSLSCSTAPNTLTVTDNGNTYCAPGTGFNLNLQTASISTNNVAAVCWLLPASSELYISGDCSSFSIYILDSAGPTGGVGTFPVYADSPFNVYAEKFAGGQSYKMTGGTITVTAADSTHITATFTLNVYNSSGSKTITGSIHTTGL